MKRARVVRKELKMLYMKYWRGVRWIGLMVLAFPAYAAETVIVTATRTAEMVDETLAPVTVITRKEIEDLQAAVSQMFCALSPG